MRLLNFREPLEPRPDLAPNFHEYNEPHRNSTSHPGSTPNTFDPDETLRNGRGQCYFTGEMRHALSTPLVATCDCTWAWGGMDLPIWRAHTSPRLGSIVARPVSTGNPTFPQALSPGCTSPSGAESSAAGACQYRCGANQWDRKRRPNLGPNALMPRQRHAKDRPT